VPLDQKIQDSAWKNKKLNNSGNFTYYSLSAEDEFIVLTTRSIFDKRKFQKGYVKRIDELFNIIDVDDIIAKFRLIFFEFSPFLFALLKNRQYDIIIENYLSFSEY